MLRNASETAFGAELSSPQRAAAVLRARASAAGLTLRPAATSDLAAAVAAAHAWLIAIRASSFEDARTAGHGAAAALSAIYFRVSGQRSPEPASRAQRTAGLSAYLDTVEQSRLPQGALGRIAPVLKWASGNPDPTAVLAAAEDLTAGAANPRLAAAAEALLDYVSTAPAQR